MDEESFMLLDDASIAALIPRIGFRVKFKKYHSELLGVSSHSLNDDSFFDHMVQVQSVWFGEKQNTFLHIQI